MTAILNPPPPAARRNLRRALLTWFAGAARDLPWRRTRDPYAVWVSEVMLQQTRSETVMRYFAPFLAAFPTIEALAAADDGALLKQWEGLGYYARALRLRDAAKAVADRHGGRVPDDPAVFAELPGVGPYIGAAVQSIAFGRPTAALDGNVGRVLARLCASPLDPRIPGNRAAYQAAADALLSHSDPGAFNQAMMELGSRVCRARTPLCDACPVARWCAARREGRTGDYPVRPAPRARPVRTGLFALIVHDGRLLMHKRPPEGLWAGLWTPPGIMIDDTERPSALRSGPNPLVRGLLEAWGMRVVPGNRADAFEHAFTHFTLRAQVVWCVEARFDAPIDGALAFRSLDELHRDPMPAPFRRRMDGWVAGRLG